MKTILVTGGSGVLGRALLPALEGRAGVRHVVYVSIVGCDQVRAFPYYRAKTQAEALVAAGGVPFTVVRATQFHEFVAFLLSRLTRAPLLPLPGLPLQPVDVHAAAAGVAQVALGDPQGRAPDLVGPQVLPLPELARS